MAIERRLTASLESISPVMCGRQFDLHSVLLEGQKMHTTIERQDGGRSTWQVFPEHYAHLLPEILETAAGERRWK